MPVDQVMHEGRVLMNEVERDRLFYKRLHRRAWGTALAAFGFVLLVFFLLGALFLVWLWNLIEGSPTIS